MTDPLLGNPLSESEARLKNPLALAFVGDTVWDLLIRQQLLHSASRVGTLHKQAIQRVNAGAQAEAAKRIQPTLSEAEADVFRRGENAHPKHAVPKHQDPVAYSLATGLEALMGYLYLTGQHERITALFDIACQKG